MNTSGPQAVLKLLDLYFFERRNVWQSHKTNSESAKHVVVLSLCMVVKMGEAFYCGPVCSHFFQEVLGIILEWEMRWRKSNQAVKNMLLLEGVVACICLVILWGFVMVIELLGAG